MVLPIRYSLLRIGVAASTGECGTISPPKTQCARGEYSQKIFSSSLTLLRTGVKGQLLSAARLLTLSVNTFCKRIMSAICLIKMTVALAAM